MTPADLRAWQSHMAYTYDTAAAALGMSRSGYAKLLSGQSPIDRRTALACSAIVLGAPPFSAGQIDASQAQQSRLVRR